MTELLVLWISRFSKWESMTDARYMIMTISLTLSFYTRPSCFILRRSSFYSAHPDIRIFNYFPRIGAGVSSVFCCCPGGTQVFWYVVFGVYEFTLVMGYWLHVWTVFICIMCYHLNVNFSSARLLSKSHVLVLRGFWLSFFYTIFFIY